MHEEGLYEKTELRVLRALRGEKIITTKDAKVTKEDRVARE
jgi:hypothetical protein